MGLFFWITGYLSFGKSIKSIKDLIRRKAYSSLIPYTVFWIISMIVLEIQNYLVTHQFVNISLNHILGLLLGGHWLADNSINFPIWYFQLYFIASIVFEAFIKRLNVKLKVITFVFLILITIPFQTVIYGRPAFHINVLPAALVFMLMGYAFHYLESKMNNRLVFVKSFCLLVFGWRISSIFYGNISCIGNNLYYIGALSTILGFYYITYLVKGKYLQNFLSYIGTKNKWILGLHILMVKSAFDFTNFILVNIGIQSAFFFNIVGVSITIVLCCGIEECVQALKNIKQILKNGQGNKTLL